MRRLINHATSCDVAGVKDDISTSAAADKQSDCISEHERTDIRKSPRMRRLASQLSMIKISLDPPSPPPPPVETDEIENNDRLEVSTSGCVDDSVDRDELDSPPPFTWTHHYANYARFIDASQLLQVPRFADYGDAAVGATLTSIAGHPPRQCSPPPRRCSYASTTTSENSSTSLNASYQNLLSPFSGFSSSCYNSGMSSHRAPIFERSGSQSLGSDDCETPPLGVSASLTTVIDFSGSSNALSRVQRKKFSEGSRTTSASSSRRPSACRYCYRRGRSVGAVGDFLTVPPSPSRPLSALSTPGELTMLLSPVLSRPVRSQSAHSTAPFLMTRSVSTCAYPPMFIADTDDSATPGPSVLSSPRVSAAGTLFSHHHHQKSSTRSGMFNTNDDSSLAGTPPPLCHSPTAGAFHAQFSGAGLSYTALTRQQHSLPGSGFFSRSPAQCGNNGYHLRTQQHQAARAGAGASEARIHHRHCIRYYCSQRGSISQHDSFDSTGSAGSALLNITTTQSVHSTTAQAISRGATLTLPVSTTSTVFLQRSHSDAQELKDYRQRYQRLQNQRSPQVNQAQQQGNCPSSSTTTRKLDNSQLGGAGAGSATAASAAARQLDELHLQRIRRMRRKTSHSTRHGSNADGLNSSLESNSGASSHYFSVSTMYAPGLSGATPPPAFSSGLLHQHPGHGVANLSRLRYCSLGHSDPQLYTLSTYTHSAHSVPVASHCSPHAGHRHHQRSIGHASHVGGGLLGYVNPSLPTHSIDNTAVATTAAVSGGTRRSFLSASSLTPTRLRKESLLVTSPRASIGGTSPASSAASGGSSSGGRRRHLDLLQSSPSPSCGSTSVADRRHSARRSIGGEASSSAAAANFGRIRIRSSTGAAHHLLPSTSAAAGNNALLRQPIALRAGGGNGAHNLAAPANKDNRRWSLASLPSSSGYGTPGSNSAFSSQYSSQEHLAEVLMDMRVGSSGVQHNHFDSNDSYSGFDELIAGGGIFGFRPRSRSLTSPLRAGSDGGAESAPQILSSVYKERFPKAKAQMESRLQQFLIANAPLSGFTSSAPALNLNLETCVPLGTTSSGDVNDSSCSYVSRTTSPTMSRSVASDIPSAQQLNSSANTSMRRGGTVRGHSRSTSPRPTSVLPPRPISPLAIGSATASADGVVFRSISPAPTSASRSNLTLCAGGDTSLSPASSSQNLDDAAAVTTSIESATPKINSALIAAAHLSHSGSGGGGSATSNNSGSVASGGMLSVANRSHRSSFIITAPGEHLTPSEHALLRIISDGATRFLHHQLCEICADCLLKSRDDILTCAYFCNMSVRLDETLAEAEVKVGAESYKYLAGLVRQILMIVSRTARLLECLEFDPDEFYQLLEEAEGTVREQLGCGSARVPDLPQYIIGKLGLNKNLLVDQPLDDGAGTTCDDDLSSFIAEDAAIDEEIRAVTSRRLSVLGGSGDDTTNVVTREKDAKLDPVNAQSLAHAAPREEDYESIRLISNGAYGAVYLVRHHQTRQRFALKKMKKQTLILRNQVDQVYAERDILTFTDNPFVVCFYGSFETRQHLCMLMEYVEGGDCAALLKSAGTLPIELTRLYVAETVLAIEYLHSCGIVHRDLKPDNLLITTMGHIKLTDFGLSKIGLMNRTTLVSEGYLDDTQQFKDNQLCGTPEYIAPCVILRQGYGKPVDWWALGIILYEFLIGVVPFMGDTPEELFANIINEEVEYPEGDEALDLNAESLIRMLLEKNPVDRLGTVGGAAEVASHPFFNSLDFDSLLRQKAEFVPQLENEEDTSYFDSREDRYNHEVDSGDDENAPMFWSFSTASPRHSIVGLEIPTGTLAGLQALAESNATASCCADETGSGVLNQTNRRQSAFSAVRQTTDSQDCQITDSRLPPSSGSVGTKSLENQPIPSAVILRRRFSAARHANLSTSSSGTTVTGPTANTCSSTDSSVDASHFSAIGMDTCGSASRRHNTVSSGVLTAQLPRLAISPCTELTQQQQQQGHVCGVPIRRAAATVGNVDCGNSVGQTSAGVQNSLAELSPVEETTVASSAHSISALLTNQPHDNISDSNTGLSMEKRPSTVAHALLTDSASSASFSDETFISRSARSLSGRSNSLRVMIPQQQQVPASNASSPSGPVASLYQQSAQTNCLSGASSVNTSYYHSYGVGGGGLSLAGGQLSPSSCRSVSSISSLDGGTNSPSNASEAHPPVAASSPLSVLSTAKSNTATTLPLVESDVSTIASHDRSSSSILSISQQQHLPPPPIIKHPHQSQSQQQQSKKIKICKGPQGYGFTIRSVRVYLSEVSEYYTIEHIVAVVREPSPAYDAGLRENDLITHVHMQPVHNLSHPQLMHRLLSCGGEITLHVTPLNNTSIREGEARRNVGKLLRKKPRRPGVSCGGAGGSAARRSGMEKKPRKASALLRRLSGKRTAGDIVPGTSSQKQTFMPRSVSSQDGALAVNPVVGATPKSGQYLTTADAANTSYSATSTVITPATNSVSCRSPVLTSGSLRHHSSFKGISGGGDNGDGKSPPLIASTFHQKRLSDFGIGCSASSSSPLTSTTNSSLGSGDFLHLQPMASAHYLPHTHQSPLVASSKSAPLPPVQDNVLTSTNFKNSGTTEISDGDSTEKLARLTLTRPNTLIQNPTSPTKLSKPILDNFLPSLPLPRVGADISSVSKTTGNTLTMPAVPSAQMTLNNANGGLQQRSMPLSPLARQSSSSSTIAAAMAQQQQNQVITHQPASRRMSGLTSIIPVGTTATSSQKRDSNTDKKEPTVNVLSAISTTTSMTTAKVYRTSLDVRDAEQQKNKDVTQQSGRHRSPSPPRKISPSRIMHRIFRVGSQSAAHTSQSTNSGTNSPNEISNNSSLSASSASPKHTGIRKQ